MKKPGALAVLGLAAWLCGCVDGTNGALDVRFGGKGKGKGKDGKALSQFELQQDIERFAGQFLDNVTEAAEPLADVQDAEVREMAMRRLLLYHASTLEIATGPLPEINVLDMLVFLALSRGALERHWNPHVFGAQGAELAAAFEQGERTIAPIADKLLSPEQRANVDALIQAWERAHPNQTRVEGVRFLEFSMVAGAVSQEQAQRASGLLWQVKAATQAADQAIMLGERAMFLTHRLPFLVRVQARLGVQETISDTVKRVDASQVQGMLDGIPEARGMIRELSLLTANAKDLTHEARLLLVDQDATDGSQTRHASLQQTLATAERLTDKTIVLLRELNALVPEDPARGVEAFEQRVDRVGRRWLVYLVLLGAAWSLFFWGGCFIVRRLTRAHS